MAYETQVEPGIRRGAPRSRAPVTLPSYGGLLRAPETYLVVVAWFTIIVSQTALSLSRVKEYRPVTADPVPVADWVETVSTAGDAILMLTCFVLVAVRFRSISWHAWPLLLVLLVPWMLLVLRLVQLDRVPGVAALPYLALAVTFWVIRPRLAVIELTGYLTGVTAGIAILLGLLVPWAGRFVGPDESGLVGLVGSSGVLAGTYPTGNNLGRALVLGLAAVLTIRHVAARYVALALTLVAVGWSLSRTSWLAVVVVAGLVVALWLVRRLRAYRSRVVEPVAAAALGVLAFAMVALPFVVREPTAFNNRAGFWQYSLERWRDEPLLGLGADFYLETAASSAALGGFAYHAHNQIVQILVGGGLLLAVAFLVLLVLAARRALVLMRAGHDWALLFLAVVLTAGVLEVPVSFADNVKANAAAMLPLLILLSTRDVAGRMGDGPRVEPGPVERAP